MPPEHFHSLRVECVHCCKLSGAEFDHTFWWYNIAARARRRVCGDYPLSMSIPRLLGSMLRPSSSRFRAFIRVRCVSVRAAESAPDACRRVSAHRSMSYLTLVCAFWVYKVANRSKMSLSFAPPRNPISAAGTPKKRITTGLLYTACDAGCFPCLHPPHPASMPRQATCCATPRALRNTRRSDAERGRDRAPATRPPPRPALLTSLSIRLLSLAATVATLPSA